MIILRTLLENQLSRNRALRAEHGLSFLVETEEAQKRMGESAEPAFCSHLKTGYCIFLS